MNKVYLLSILISISVFFNLSAQTNIKIIEIKNSNFELTDENNTIAYWTSDNKLSVSVDQQNFVSGKSSVHINHSVEQQTTIISEQVELKIGHLYKLSAMVKSENAFTNPSDRYPTSVAGCLTMESFPFTNHSPAFGAAKDWYKIEVEFIATKKSDRVRLHLGFNGKAIGKV